MAIAMCTLINMQTLKQHLIVLLIQKTQRYGVCNAAESLIVHKSFPKSHIAKILSELDHHLVEIRGCKKIKSIFKKAHLAKESDWYEEYLRPGYISENSK